MPPPEPFLSFHTILSIVAFPALGFYMRSLIRYREESDNERHRSIKESISKLEKCISSIKREIDEKRDAAECEKRSKEKWDRINKHTHDPSGRVVIT